MTQMDRRRLLQAGLAAGATLALPTRVFAQAWSITDQHRRLLAVAKEQVERMGSALWRTDIAGIADFGLPSSLPRFHFANLEKGEVRSFLVAHGKGSDPEHDGFLKTFSNEPGSYATSRGAFVTNEWYKGKYGTSIRLGGADQDNSNALERAIVIHRLGTPIPTCWRNTASLAAARDASPWPKAISWRRCGTFPADG